jgi:hypothetical protein
MEEARQAPPVGIFSEGDSYKSSVSEVVRTAGRAVRTGEIAPVLISSWTGFAPSALARGERPQVPARTGTSGRLVEWYRKAFERAVLHGIIESDWYRIREQWHAEAFNDFPADVAEYYEHIYAAERALRSKEERRRLAAGSEGINFKAWYARVFERATQVGLCQPAGDERDLQ